MNANVTFEHSPSLFEKPLWPGILPCNVLATLTAQVESRELEVLCNAFIYCTIVILRGTPDLQIICDNYIKAF